MANNNTSGFPGSYSGAPGSVQGIGSQIASNQGGLQYEQRPGASLSGGSVPERNTYTGHQEAGYEHVSAPSVGVGQGTKYESGGASIGGAGINKSTVGTGGTGTAPSTTSGAPTGVYQQTVDTVQRTAEPYVAQAREAAAPYVAKAQEVAQPYVAKAQEVAEPYVAKAQEVGAAAYEQARPVINQAAGIAAEKASQAYNAAATELDARGINKDSTQQKLAEVGQTMKDYGTIAQQRGGEYFQQAVDQAKTIGQDGENKSIVATIFGTVFLVWLAFGFSIGAVFALGVAGSIAAVLSRYSRGHGTSTASLNQPTGQPALGGNSSHTAGTGGRSTEYGSGGTSGYSSSSTAGVTNSGVETHYPRPAHPDNSLNTGLGK